MSNIYNLSYNIQNLIAQSNEAETTDEEREQIYHELESLTAERDDVLNYLADFTIGTELLIAESKKLNEQRTIQAQWAERLIARLLNGQPLDTPLHSFKWRKSTAVAVTDFTMLPESFRRIVPAKEEPDKVAIKKAMTAGEHVSGAILETRNNLTIK